MHREKSAEMAMWLFFAIIQCCLKFQPYQEENGLVETNKCSKNNVYLSSEVGGLPQEGIFEIVDMRRRLLWMIPCL